MNDKHACLNGWMVAGTMKGEIDNDRCWYLVQIKVGS